ncbi:MAG: hypothetical protein JRF55_14060 [Deltaproteobacteria bacterium]|nr:hypothetical protein [Deltaproteobacteria bacterium]
MNAPRIAEAATRDQAYIHAVAGKGIGCGHSRVPDLQPEGRLEAPKDPDEAAHSQPSSTGVAPDARLR